MKNLRRFLAVIIMAAVITAFMPQMGNIAGSSDYQASAAVSEKTVKGIQNTTLKITCNVQGYAIINIARSKGYKVDYYEVFRSEKENSGYGKKAYGTTKTTEYIDEGIAPGETCYYKVRGVRKISGKKYYTKWSNKVSATVYSNKVKTYTDTFGEGRSLAEEEVQQHVEWINTQKVIERGEFATGELFWIYKDSEGKVWVFVTAPDKNIYTAERWNEEMLELVNKERAKEGLEPLVLNDQLIEAAMLRAEECSEVYSHTRPDGSDCFSIISSIGMNCAGENISEGCESVAEAVEMWMNSPYHRSNIMCEDFTQVGFGFKVKTEYNDYNRSYYCTQIFIG